MVYLVGAGPGDPDLISVKGLRVLQQADVVLYDRLVNPELIARAPETALKISVGKPPRSPDATPQSRIHELLLEHGRSAEVVVRLKGGDPYVFGRGAEEADALAEASIPFEVVPGITSAIAGPAAAGIPVTLRHVANAFGVFTGHGASDSADDSIPWAAAAGLPTSVFLMGVERLPEIVRNLLDHGLPAETPLAIVSNATLPEQEAFVSTLGAVLAEQRAWEAPAVLVVGEVARRCNP